MSVVEHLEKLRHFQRLVSFSSIREGSQSMGISQAGLSKSISSLEEALGTPLFLRSRDGLTLTKEGAEVLLSAERILQEAAGLEMKLRSLKASSTPDQLKIGMYDSIAVYFYADFASYIRTLYPHVKIELLVDTSASLANEISQGRLDLAIGVNFDQKTNSSLEFFKLFDDSFGLYVSTRAELDVATLPVLLHAATKDSKDVSLEAHLKPFLKKRAVHRVFNFETLKTLTSQGVGIGILPTQVAKPLLKKGVLVKAEVLKAKNQFGPHTIGFLATKSFLKGHRDFADDIYRLGTRWSES